jgi:hypothetical protein
MIKKKETKGGKRKGAGRKPAPYQTKTIAFRVRTEWVEEIKLMVKTKMAELNKNNKIVQ